MLFRAKRFAFEVSRALYSSAARHPDTKKPRSRRRSSGYRSNFCVHISTDPQSDVARARSWAAICVQDFDAPCVLQFAWFNALCCALHRSTSQVIHRSGSYNVFSLRDVLFDGAPERLATKVPTSKRTSKLVRVRVTASPAYGLARRLRRVCTPIARYARRPAG